MMPEGDPGTLAPSEYAENLLPYVRGLGERVEIEGEVFSNLDSTDLEPSHWEGLGRLIVSRLQDYDGFVVLHGTDTMAYTASALFFHAPELAETRGAHGFSEAGSRGSNGCEEQSDSLRALCHPGHSRSQLVFWNPFVSRKLLHKDFDSVYEAFDSPNLDPLIEMGWTFSGTVPACGPR